MSIYLLAYLLASSVLGPFLAELVLNRNGDEDDASRVIKNALSFWVWPLLAAIVLLVLIRSKGKS